MVPEKRTCGARTMVPENVSLQIGGKPVVPENRAPFWSPQTQIGHRFGHRTAAKFGHHTLIARRTPSNAQWTVAHKTQLLVPCKLLYGDNPTTTIGIIMARASCWERYHRHRLLFSPALACSVVAWLAVGQGRFEVFRASSGHLFVRAGSFLNPLGKPFSL